MSVPKHAATRPATFRDLFSVREYRAIFTASALSWVGDYLARAAVTALVFHTTHSVVLSAASFAVGYLPGLTAGPFLAALAERYPHRNTMVTCDLVRAVLIGCVAIRGLPVGAIFLLLFCTALLGPPFDASRSAFVPRILDNERYVLGVSLQNTTIGLATVVGYAVGGSLAPNYPHAVLFADAITFVISAVLIGTRTRLRPPGLATTERRGLVRETAAGFRLVWSSPMLRAIAVIVLGAWLFAIVPEGLAAAWAAQLAHGGRSTGTDQALIMMSVPAGNIAGAIVVGRLFSPARRQATIRPLAVLVPLALVPTLLHPSATGTAIMGVISGFAVAGLASPSNGLFVQALPAAFRSRAFGVMQFGLQFVQAAALLLLGVLAGKFAIPTVVGLWSLGGVVVMVLACLTWPPAHVIEETIAEARAANEATHALDRAADPATDHAAADTPVGVADQDAEPATGTAERPRRGSGARPSPRPSLRAASIPVRRPEPPSRVTDPQI